MDPTGIVPKMEHILDSADENLKSEIRKIAPKADESEVQTLSNVAEIAVGLNNMFKIVRHFYISGTKQGGTYSISTATDDDAADHGNGRCILVCNERICQWQGHR